jgi:hypothetical protein
MDKLVYILWDSKAHMADSRQQVLLRQVARDLLAAGAEKLTVYIADRDAKVRSPAPFHPGEPMCAEVAIWLNTAPNASRSSVVPASGSPGILVDTEYGVVGMLAYGTGLTASVPQGSSP